jgi:hypothetical protein
VTGGQLVIGFGVGTTSVKLESFVVQMPGINYELNGTATTSTSLFSIFPEVKVNSAVCSGCQSSAYGFFAGASAERAGLSYLIQGGGQTVVGAAAFKK